MVRLENGPLLISRTTLLRGTKQGTAHVASSSAAHSQNKGHPRKANEDGQVQASVPSKLGLTTTSRRAKRAWLDKRIYDLCLLVHLSHQVFEAHQADCRSHSNCLLVDLSITLGTKRENHLVIVHGTPGAFGTTVS